MDVGPIRELVTIFIFLAFLGAAAWAWHVRRDARMNRVFRAQPGADLDDS